MNLLFVIVSCVVLIVWGGVFYGNLCRYPKGKIFRGICYNLGIFFLTIGATEVVSMLLK